MQDYRQLFQRQSTTWPLAEKNYQALSEVVFKDLTIDHIRIRLQFNPGRMTSSAADTSKDAIRARPCFLCAENRPSEQESLTFKTKNASISEFQILVNPFPVFPQHFTIASTEHQLQAIHGNFKSFLQLGKSMEDCVIFYNGPRCGASAPDHLHFQAGSKGIIPLESDYGQWKKTLIRKGQDMSVSKMEGLLRNGLVMEGSDSNELSDAFEQLLDLLKSENPASTEEPMLNLLCWYQNGSWICLIFPRKAHRPKCYFKNDDTKLLISPAAVEMGGVMVAARREDFDKIEEKEIREIYGDVSVSEKEIDLISKKFKERKP